MSDDEDTFWEIPKFGEMPYSQLSAVRLQPNEVVELLGKVRHNLQIVADEEGVTGPVTETVLAIDVILQSIS